MYLDLYLRLMGVKKNFNLWLNAKQKTTRFASNKNRPGKRYDFIYAKGNK